MLERSTRGWLTWYGCGLAAAIAVGWLTASLHAAGIAPLVLLPLGIGIVLGAVLHALAATLRVAGGRKSLIIGAICLALVAVLAQHAWLYRDFRRQWHEARAKSPEVALFRPEAPWSPREYFARELTPQQAALWLADAALITTAAAVTMLVLQRKQN